MSIPKKLPFNFGKLKLLVSELKRSNIKKISSDFKKENFGLKEIWSLILLSVRSYYWKPNHKELHKELIKKNSSSLAFALWLVSWIIGPGSLLFCLAMPILDIVSSIQVGDLSLFIKGIPVYVFVELVLLPAVAPYTFNLSKLFKNIHFIEDAWYQNTGIRPSQITSDVGIYGEYIATCAAENALLINGCYGKVFNNVFIPKRDGSFNEVDVISVSEMGIHVIEAKARTGLLSGTLLGDYWVQNEKHQMQNPLKQNLGHCNILTEYLYEQLPDCKLKEGSLFEKLVNVSLFTLTGIQDNINKSEVPPMQFFLSMAEEYAVYPNKDKLLTKQEVDMICAILDKISHYSPHQREQMIQEREEAYARGDFKRGYEYYIAKIEYPGNDGNWYEAEVICKDNGIYQTYANNIDGWYIAVPNGIVTRISNSTLNESEVRRYYSKIMTQ